MTSSVTSLLCRFRQEVDSFESNDKPNKFSVISFITPLLCRLPQEMDSSDSNEKSRKFTVTSSIYWLEKLTAAMFGHSDYLVIS